MSIRVFCVCTLVALATLSTGCWTEPSVPCYSDRDCKSNFHCVAPQPSVGTTSAERAAPMPHGDVAAPPPGYYKPDPSKGTKGTCQPKPEPKRCFSNRECGPGMLCKETTQPPTSTCTKSEDGRTRCLRARPPSGICVPAPPKPPVVRTCRTNNDCDDDEICQEKQSTGCAKAGSGSSTPGSTGSGAPAAPPERDDREEFRKTAPCMPVVTRVCVPKPQTSCRSDRDCKAHETCQLENSAGLRAPCRTDSKGNQACDPMPPSTGRCVTKKPTLCSSDRSCKSGEFCDFNAKTQSHAPDEDRADPAPGNKRAPGAMPAPPPARTGICRPRPKMGLCKSNADCKRNQRCTWSSKPRPVAPCPRGVRCFAKAARRGYGVCKDIPVKRCKSDGDCGRNQQCVRGPSTGTGNTPDPDDAPDAPAPAPRKCAPGSNCGAPAPPPPPVQYGTCQDKPTCVETKRSPDGTVCFKCNDGTSRCSTPGRP